MRNFDFAIFDFYDIKILRNFSQILRDTKSEISFCEISLATLGRIERHPNFRISIYLDYQAFVFTPGFSQLEQAQNLSSLSKLVKISRTLGLENKLDTISSPDRPH